MRHLPGAQCLAVLCDGALLLLHVDTLDGTRATGVSGVTAMTGEGSPTTLPPTLALASKPNKKVLFGVFVCGFCVCVFILCVC